MAKVGYFSPENARMVLDTVRQIRATGILRFADPRQHYDCYIILLDAGGVSARSGSTVGTGTGTPYFINDSNQLEELPDDDGTVPTKTVYNISETSVDGDQYVICVTVAGRPVVITGSASVSSGCGLEAVIFQIVEQSGVAEAASAHCDDQLNDAASSYEATVLWRVCCKSRVSGETDAGTITVTDPLGSFFDGRENSEVQGRKGIAIYLKEDNGYECQWVVSFMDWWREIQVIHDVIHTADEIRFKVKRVQVWDDCNLDDIVIPLVDCSDTS